MKLNTQEHLLIIFFFLLYILQFAQDTILLVKQNQPKQIILFLAENFSYSYSSYYYYRNYPAYFILFSQNNFSK